MPPVIQDQEISRPAQVIFEAHLHGGSAGFAQFVKRLSQYVFPHEAASAEAAFRHGRRVLVLSAVAFGILYLVMNEALGPLSLRAESVGNDFLRAGLVVLLSVLLRRYRIIIAGQVLLPLVAMTFLPMGATGPDQLWERPALFGAIAVGLWGIGWLLDVGRSTPHPVFRYLHPVATVSGWVLLLILTLCGWYWVIDGGTFPGLTVLAVLGSGAIPWPRWKPLGGDAEYLYEAAWRRWRFFITGRLLATMLGLGTFLLFANLMDYQEQLEQALDIGGAPNIVRLPIPGGTWQVIYWGQQGRFITTDDLKADTSGTKPIHELMAFPNETEPVASSSTAPADAADQTTQPDATPLPTLTDPALRPLQEHVISRDLFLEETSAYTKYQLTDKAKLKDALETVPRPRLVDLSYEPSGTDGVGILETVEPHELNQEELETQSEVLGRAKWIFFALGVMGFVFLWRRGGDSPLGRWIGIWLIGLSVMPSLSTPDLTFMHILDWMWRHSVLYHWNTISAVIYPTFTLIFGATMIAGFLWLMQVSPVMCWLHLCWPTRIYETLPPIVRHLVMAGKIALMMVVTGVILFGSLLPGIIWHWVPDLATYLLFISCWTVLALGAGLVLRRFTAKYSDEPRMSWWSIVAFLLLTAMVGLYSPSLIAQTGSGMAQIVDGAVGGCAGVLFLCVLSYMILKRDFLRVRAIGSFTTLTLLLVVPYVIYEAEEFLPRVLLQTPFFGSGGAEIASITLVVLLFPKLHEWLHELLLALSVPRLRHIEHAIEHAMEKIVDTDDEGARSTVLSEMFETLCVPHYLLLIRRSGGELVAEVNCLTPAGFEKITISKSLQHFLGRHRHFIDLQCMPFEWPFFFHGFELTRLMQTIDCRFLLPISVGESLRGALLLPTSADGTVVEHPAVSPHLNNLGVAAAGGWRKVEG